MRLQSNNNLESQGLTILSGQLNIAVGRTPAVVAATGSSGKGGVSQANRGKAGSVTNPKFAKASKTNCGSGQRPATTPATYSQNFHHLRGAAFKAVCASNLCNSPISLVWSAIRACRASTRAFGSSWAVPFRPGAASSTLTSHLLPIMRPVSNPWVNRRRMVFLDTFKATAASVIDNSMPSTVTHWANHSGQVG